MKTDDRLRHLPGFFTEGSTPSSTQASAPASELYKATNWPDVDRIWTGKTGYGPDTVRIIILENPGLTRVISDTYDFFYRNSHPKNSTIRLFGKPSITSPITIRFRRCLSYVDLIGVWARVKLWDHAF